MSMTRLKMLITSAGRRVALLQAFRRGAREIGIDLEVLTCDARPELSAACHVADDCFSVPAATDPNYVEVLMAACHSRGIHLLVPTIDPELPPLSRAQDQFRSLGTELAISSADVVRISRDKLATAEFFKASGLRSPATWPLDTVRKDAAAFSWPLIVKPRHGSASRAVAVVAGPDDLPSVETEPMIAQEVLEGEEWTVNLFFDQVGSLRTVIPHQRLQIRGGEVEKGITRRVDALRAIAERLAQCLPGPRGPLCFQAIVDGDGNAAAFEINARFGGGYPLADYAGASFARWLLEERIGLPCGADDTWTEGITMLRYDAAVFLEPCA